MSDATAPQPRLRWRPGEAAEEGVRLLAEETPVALVHDGSTTAVMMATPADLEDFAVGFSLSERVIESADEIASLEVARSDLGVEVRLWLTPERTRDLAARRRRLAGPTGCGLCGVESLEEAARAPLRVADDGLRVSGQDLLTAMAQMEAAQALSRATRAVHAAGLWSRDGGPIVREDIGRHNALDKLIGAAVRQGTTRREVLLLTSRVSVEMVQKAAVLGAPVLCAVSAPTALAIRTAEAAGLTLVGVARSDGFEVFTNPQRLELG
ncbi:MAG: formate dehydrogenase accessory sulfurtransferase FdhD [Proteobacteria bacterium]|nr:formate dehydrogenase accessory sulfurtransferase FdhD [Pseudomonadota bacterium]